MPLEIVSNVHEQPKVWCYVCGAGFGASKMGRPFEEHVARCSEEHDEHLRQQSFRVRAPHLFDPFVSGDVELGAYIRANSAAILHRRLKI
ncbi:hypothetical protein DSM104299_03239 [Baekduia alba]|uniref:hypothetical protein n=1 Tax=Baekduia alba TaxID=2997333 RepID=UPI0023406A74|nr:hypothetical protein [Baekduia alba]WCB94502.1 hypothetical protein DSM104299_03239 [Baekduia alba]